MDRTGCERSISVVIIIWVQLRLRNDLIRRALAVRQLTWKHPDSWSVGARNFHFHKYCLIYVQYCTLLAIMIRHLILSVSMPEQEHCFISVPVQCIYSKRLVINAAKFTFTVTQTLWYQIDYQRAVISIRQFWIGLHFLAQISDQKSQRLSKLINDQVVSASNSTPMGRGTALADTEKLKILAFNKEGKVVSFTSPTLSRWRDVLARFLKISQTCRKRRSPGRPPILSASAEPYLIGTSSKSCSGSSLLWRTLSLLVLSRNIQKEGLVGMLN